MTPSGKSVVVCVTGMHRSGTSLTASWLGHCGLVLDDGEVYGAAEGNPRGHFEDKQIVDLQSAQTLRHDPTSRGWIYTKRKTLPVDAQFDREARALIESRNARYPLWGWKDPRTVLYLESWRALIPDLKVLLLWRPCAGIASSLVARASASDQTNLQIGARRSVKLWRRYNERVLAHKSRYPAESLLFSVDTVVAHDRRVFDRIQNLLGLKLNYKALAELYEERLLQDRRQSLVQRAAARYYQVERLEDQLESASDSI